MSELSQSELGNQTQAEAESSPSAGLKVGNYEIFRHGSGRQFESDFLEKFSYCPGWVPLVVYVPLVLALLAYGYLSVGTSLGKLAGLFFLGLFIWSFAEYWLHRVVFHFERWWKFHYFLHGIHHMYPNDLGRLVMPPGASLPLAVLFWLIAWATAGFENAIPAFAGFVVGYLWYDMTHLWTHVAKPTSAYGKLLRRHHMTHHFKTPNRRFGVSSPFWDLVFGTYGDGK